MAKARIKFYFHCKNCMIIGKHPDGTDKIESTEKIVVGWTKQGFQIFCENCNQNVIDVDFKGNRVAYFDPNAKTGRRGSPQKVDNGKKPSLSRKE